MGIMVKSSIKKEKKKSRFHFDFSCLDSLGESLHTELTASCRSCVCVFCVHIHSSHLFKATVVSLSEFCLQCIMGSTDYSFISVIMKGNDKID